MTEEISEELKKQAQAARDNKTDFYTCEATGNTHPVKEDLRCWGFFWDTEKNTWTVGFVSAWLKFIFESKVADGDWPGVILKFTKEK